MRTARAMLSIAGIYSPEILEKACGKAPRQCHMPCDKAIYPRARSIDGAEEFTWLKENNKKSGAVRGAGYYRKGGMDKRTLKQKRACRYWNLAALPEP